MRIGVHTRLVVIGELGSIGKREFAATGDAMNHADRLQKAAPVGGVLISDDTYRYIRGLFDLSIQPIEALNTAYYFRFSAVDKPGVLSKISGILGDNQISIASVIQKGREINGSVPIVMLTHEARESSVKKALSLMDQLDVLTDKTMVIRVEEE